MCFVLFTAATIAQTPTGEILVLNQPIEREIKGGESQFYAVNIGAMNTARVEIVQKGVDVSLAAYNPGGEKFLEAQSPSGVLGNDLILITAIQAGEYKVSVEPATPKAALGKYQIKLTEIRPTVAEDNAINERARQVYALNNEITVLQQKNTHEGRRQIVEKYQQIIALARLQADKVLEIVAVVLMGLTYDQLGEFQTAIDSHEIGLRLSREIGNREHEGSALNNVGNSYKTLGDYEKAVFYLTQSLDIRQTGRLHKRLLRQ
jgi:tetratricopeptide (TPR) repeat protein